jgi:hypothetical protein
MTNGMATTKLLMKADMLGRGVWQRARVCFADRDIRTLRVQCIGPALGGFQGCIKYLDIVLALGMGRAA